MAAGALLRTIIDTTGCILACSLRENRDTGCIGRYLDVPGATVGGLMAGTYKPRCSSWADALRAAASLPTIRGTMGDSAGIPKPSASRSTRPHRCFRLSGS